MCKKPYYGWMCGHQDLSATDLPIEPCDSERYPHEPFCSPLIHELIIRKVPEDDAEDHIKTRVLNSQIDVCAACHDIMERLVRQWEAKKTELRHEGTATERDLESIQIRLGDDATAVLEKGRLSGPNHTVHVDELESGQQTIFHEVDHELKELRDAKIYFRTEFDVIKSKGLIRERTLREYRRKYVMADYRRTALNKVQVKNFRDTIDQYVKELSMKHIAREVWKLVPETAAAHKPHDKSPSGEVETGAKAELFGESPSGEVEPGAEADPEAEPKSVDENPSGKAEPEAEAELGAEVKPEAKPESVDENPSGEAEPGVEAEPGAEVEPEVGAGPEAEAELGAEPESVDDSASGEVEPKAEPELFDENPSGEFEPEAKPESFDPNLTGEVEPEAARERQRRRRPGPRRRRAAQHSAQADGGAAREEAREVEVRPAGLAKAESLDPNPTGEAERRILSEATLFTGTGRKVEAELFVTREEAERRLISPVVRFPQENRLIPPAVLFPQENPTGQAVQQIRSAAAIQNPHAKPAPEPRAELEAEAELLDENRETELQILAQAEIFPPNRSRGRGRAGRQRGGYRRGRGRSGARGSHQT